VLTARHPRAVLAMASSCIGEFYRAFLSRFSIARLNATRGISLILGGVSVGHSSWARAQRLGMGVMSSPYWEARRGRPGFEL